MRYKFESYGDLADFVERILRGQLENRWELDDFESIVLARNEKHEKWPIELWRRCILDVAGMKRPPAGQWMHPDARPYMEKIMEVLRYIDEAAKEDSSVNAED